MNHHHHHHLTDPRSIQDRTGRIDKANFVALACDLCGGGSCSPNQCRAVNGQAVKRVILLLQVSSHSRSRE